MLGSTLPASLPLRRLALAFLGGSCLAACTAWPGPASARNADLILTNAKVYTVEPGQPWAEAVAIADGKVLAAGTAAEVEKTKGAATRTVDLRGRVLMPAFGDAHVHPLFGGISYSRCSLHNGQSVDDYRQVIRGCLAKTPSGTVYGVGWKDGLFPPDGIPSKTILDEISTERPLIFESTGGHSIWLNSKALELLGITRDTPDPANGVINRDPATGEPIGGLQESAMALATPLIPAPTPEDIQNAIIYTAHHFNELGITSWHDALIDVDPGGSAPVIDAYKAVKDRSELTSHVTLALKWNNDRALDQLADIERASAHARELGLHADTVKFFVDGVIPQKTAAMLEPYEGTADETGETQIPPDLLDAAVTAVDGLGMQVHFHSIGDRATRDALDAVEAARKADGMQDTRPMISHLNAVDPADQPRFGQLGVTAVFQPLWASIEPYMLLTIDRIGPKRAKYIYPARSVLEDGGRLAYGSDWPVASANPFEGIQVALTRSNPYAPGSEQLLPEQAVSLEEAIKAYTINVAYVLHLEQQTGSIAPGKSADLIVLDRDLFSLDPYKIGETKVLLTLFEGKPVFGSLEKLD